MKARVKRVVINQDILAHIFETGTGWLVESGIPSGAILRGVTQDPHTQCLHMFVEHSDFEEVSIDGQVAPQLDMFFKRI
jgi:hypothetical protein